MPVYYKLSRIPNAKKDGMPTPYYPRFVNQRTCPMNKVVELASAFSSFSSADIVGVLEALIKVVALELTNGNNVEIEGIGTFTVSLKCPPLYKKSDITAQYVKFKTIKVRVAAELKNRVKDHMRIYRYPDTPLARFRPDQRRKILIEHIQEHLYITAKEYRSQTNLCKSVAAKELKQFIKEGVIVKMGQGPATFYMFPKK